jgi:flagellar protein FlgJ
MDTPKILPLPLREGAGGRGRNATDGASIPLPLTPSLKGRGSMAGATDTAALQKAARDFEAMAIGQLLAPMFDTVDSAHGLFGGGAGEETWKPMLVAEFGKHIAAHGGFGLAAPVMAAMLRMQEAQQAGPRSQTP